MFLSLQFINKLFQTVFIYVLAVTYFNYRLEASVLAIKNKSKDSLLMFFEKAEHYYKNGNLNEALNCYLQALSYDASNTRILYRVGEIYYLLDNQRESLNYLSKLLQLLPQNVDGRLLLVKNLLKLGALYDAKIQLEWLKKVSNNGEVDGLIQELNNLESNSIIIQNTINEVIKKYKISNFIKEVKESLRVNLELAKYNLEKGDIRNATKYIQLAEELSLKTRETRSFLEVQIYRLLLNLYNLELRDFGKRLIKLKNLLNTDTYKSFLNVYNTAEELSKKSKSDLVKFVIGVAVGAEHEEVAIRLYRENSSEITEDIVLLRMLAEAFISTYNYDQAEKMLLKLYNAATGVAEYAMTLAKFYTTAKLDVSRAEYYLNIAAQKYPDDARIMVIEGILCCLKGDINKGIEIIKESVNRKNTDILLSKLANSILLEYVKSKERGEKFYNLKAVIQLPDRKRSEDVIKIGEESLNKGLYFIAIREFIESKHLAEIGRAYLAFSRYLVINGEKETAKIASRYGKEILQEALKYKEFAGKANLYLATYYYENKDTKTALQYIEQGLKHASDDNTKLLLRVLYSKII